VRSARPNVSPSIRFSDFDSQDPIADRIFSQSDNSDVMRLVHRVALFSSASLDCAITAIACCVAGERQAGEPFSHGIAATPTSWWHPPVGPRQVFESEVQQIEQRFGLSSIVSVTDHDDIAAGIELQGMYALRRAPISFEWTVPYGDGFFSHSARAAVQLRCRDTAFTHKQKIR
jgi:hypothetical protein